MNRKDYPTYYFKYPLTCPVCDGKMTQDERTVTFKKKADLNIHLLNHHPIIEILSTYSKIWEDVNVDKNRNENWQVMNR